MRRCPAEPKDPFALHIQASIQGQTREIREHREDAACWASRNVRPIRTVRDARRNGWPDRPFSRLRRPFGEAVTAGGAWDVKTCWAGDVRRTALSFDAANNPVYFQLLDERGRCVQTMRSWTHLQPGEAASCVGCHEDKAQAYPPRVGQAAMKIQELRPARGQPAHPLLARLKKEGLYASAANYLGVNGPVDVRAEAETAGFSFPRLVQPILDRNCVKCHDGSEKNAKRPNLTGRGGRTFRPEAIARSRSIRGAHEGRKQTVLLQGIRAWVGARFAAVCTRICDVASVRTSIRSTTGRGDEDEKRVVQCWIDLAIPFVGSYCEATVWSDDDRKSTTTQQNVFSSPEGD